MKRLAVMFLLVLGAMTGCGYTTGSLLPAEYQTLFIEPFGNKVGFVNENSRGLYVPLLETKIRTAIIDRFQLDGRLRINDSNQSDLVLKGDLISFERDDLRSDDNRNVQEYRLRIVVSLTMVDKTTGEVFWQESSFVGESTYFTTGAGAKSETEALNETMTDLARRVVERTIQNW